MRRHLLSLLVAVLLPACAEQSEITVFHAASLARSFDALARAFEHTGTRTHVRLESSGSQVAARKVSELGRRADVVAVADPTVLAAVLIPEHAAWRVAFASGELVLAHRGHSRHTEQITTVNWAEIIARHDVRLGCVDPDLAPIGYRTEIVWQLAALERGEPTLPGALRARCAPEHLMPSEGELLALLDSRSIDYAFMYRSTAEEHRLKLTPLPTNINLGRADQSSSYSRASAAVRLGGAGTTSEVRGAPILYALSIPRTAPNPEMARRFVRFLAGQEGGRILRRSGFNPLPALQASGASPLPAWLRELSAEGSSR